MMIVLTSTVSIALFVEVYRHTGSLNQVGWQTDPPILFLIAILLTALALGSWKEHTPFQIMLQITLACVGYLILIQIGEAKFERAIRYWFQTTFALTVCLPLIGRRYVKAKLARGPRRDWWKKTWEAVFFSFLNLVLVCAGGLFQAAVYILVEQFLRLPVAF